MKSKRLLKRLLIVTTVLAFLVIISLAVWSLKITEITVEGNTYYTDEEVISLIFPETNDLHTLYAVWDNRFGEKKDIPFIKNYTISITGLHSAEIIVYEKGLIGYIPYMGNYLYFDVEGYIVETSTEKIDGLLFIDGINFDFFVLNSRLPVEDDNLFYNTLVLSRLINEKNLDVDRIYFDRNMMVTLYMGDIKVYLGEATELETKILTLVDILPQIKKEKGTLYLDNYSKVNNIVEYIFKRDT